MWPWVEMMWANSVGGYRDVGAMFDCVFPGVKYIHLKRRDRIGQAVSWIRALETRQWRVWKGRRTARKIPWVAQSPAARIYQAIKANVFSDCAWRDFFNKARVPVIEVEYESLCSDIEQELGKIGRFIAGRKFRARRVNSDLLVQRDCQNEAAVRDFRKEMNRLREARERSERALRGDV